MDKPNNATDNSRNPTVKRENTNNNDIHRRVYERESKLTTSTGKIKESKEQSKTKHQTQNKHKMKPSKQEKSQTKYMQNTG